MNGAPRSVPMSWTARMFGWLSAAAARASSSKRCNRSVSAEKDDDSTLIATSRPRRESRARYTSPIPPAPSVERISYGPRRTPAARGNGDLRSIPHPVEDDGERRRPALRQKKALSVGRHVPDDDAGRCLEERVRWLVAEVRAADVDCHHPIVRTEIEQFPAVAPPSRGVAAAL